MIYGRYITRSNPFCTIKEFFEMVEEGSESEERSVYISGR